MHGINAGYPKWTGWALIFFTGQDGPILPTWVVMKSEYRICFILLIGAASDLIKELLPSFFQGALYTGLADGRIVKLEGDKVEEIYRTGKQAVECGEYHGD